jgi:putative effector of murein hydrolase LrgA (UPF0299 family)
MKKVFMTTISILFGMALFAVPLSAMLFAVLEIDKLRGTWWHAPAAVAAIIVSTLLLVGTTHVSTHLVVRLFRKDEPGVSK